MATSDNEITHDLMRTLIQLLRQTLETSAGGGLASQVEEMMTEFTSISQGLQGILTQLEIIAADHKSRSDEKRARDIEIDKLATQVQTLRSEIRRLTEQLNLPFDGSTS